MLADQDGGHGRLEPLTAQPLHGKPDQGELDHHQVAQQVGEARAGGLRRSLHLDPAMALGEIEVVERLEVEVPGLADLAERDVVLLGLPLRRPGIGEVRQ